MARPRGRLPEEGEELLPVEGTKRIVDASHNDDGDEEREEGSDESENEAGDSDSEAGDSDSEVERERRLRKKSEQQRAREKT